MRKSRIGIIGCGVGGCTAAILLARQGHAVTLFERTAHVGPLGAGVLLQASGQGVLASLGLLEEVVARAERIDELVAYTHRGGLLSRLRFADLLGGHVAYGVHRGDLFDVLYAAVMEAGVALRLNCEVGDVAPNGGVRLKNCESDEVCFDLVIAADGSRSRVRESVGVRHARHDYRYAALWAVGRDERVRGRLLQRARHTTRLCGLLPMGDGRVSFFWGIALDDWKGLRRRRFDDWQSEVVDLMPEAEGLVRTLRSFDDLVFSSYRAIWMPRVAHGRVAFLGDAAHASSPLLGQGINLAMLDARDLAGSVAEQATVGGALHRYDARQRWRNAYYAALSASLSPTFQGRSKLLGVARDLALPRMQQVGPLRRIMLRTLAGV